MIYLHVDSPYFNKTLEEIEIMKMEEKQIEDEKVLKSTVSDIEMFTNAGNRKTYYFTYYLFMFLLYTICVIKFFIWNLF